ncbi:ATP-binding protein [Conexibacter sp. CPCC 206217]|uniref:ATP-binding protein n=1 Tax=Conexibacter sp. CPCC 206217 TaxID=3064574 RepID=UPI002715F634|nr:ATP-binding protein [Conexibacter sp. CPCC 206217]MDO8213833.1 ATP-binding protein [Conexibacter sp. CPCC 206217]
MDALPQRMSAYRALREQVERALLPLASSLDGRRFSLQASLHDLQLRPGGYVTLRDDAGHERLGQLESLELVREEAANLALPSAQDDVPSISTRLIVRCARGEGRLVDDDPTAFHDYLASPADPRRVAAWLAARGARAPLPIGELARADGVPYAIDARGFDRHTFFCGQSGSGKTYSLGVVLEQLLINTELRVIVLDPNSDFVRLREAHPRADPGVAQTWASAAARIAVHAATVPTHPLDEPLRLRFPELSPAAHAALLRLDPIDDREEYSDLAQLLRERPGDVEALGRALAGEGRRLATRARNLGVDRFAVWARERPGSLLDALDRDDWRCLVVDLGSLPEPAEQALVSGALLEGLWARRQQRRPVLVVIDEAHNVCPAAPENPLTALATDAAVRIAAEGRKFGIYLLVSTQRPQKVHPNVVSQCDNLVLMRLNSAADAAHAASVFSFVPPALIEQATGFGLGESLVAGRISPHPAFVRFGARVAQEGGADVPSDWA